ncbi:MAG: response regulator [Anaerolineae bacterium]
MSSALIVEDDVESAHILEQMLQMNGAAATVALNSAQVMANVDQLGSYDVVFLDLEMPDYTGYDVFNEIQRHPHLSQLRVIAYSIYSNEMANARSMGFGGFMTKPLDIDGFGSLWQRIIAGETVWA